MLAISHNKTLKFLGLQVRHRLCGSVCVLLDGSQGSNMSSTVADGEAESAKFNPSFPDGSYHLNLSNQTDRTVAIQLCQLNASVSPSQMRNVTLDGKEIQPQNMDWPDRQTSDRSVLRYMNALHTDCQHKEY